MPLTPERLLDILRETVVGTVRLDGPDLSARQLSVLLIISIEKGPHTVRGLAARLNVSKPAVTRSLDRLQDLELAGREPDPRDRRSVLVVPTKSGRAYIETVRGLMAAAKAKRPSAKSAARRHAIEPTALAAE